MKESDLGSVEKSTDMILKGIYERAEDDLARKEAHIKQLEKELSDMKGREINYRRIAKEIRYSYPEILDISIGKGAAVDDSLNVREQTIVLASSSKPLPAQTLGKVEEWLRLRMEDSTAVVHNIIRPDKR